MKLRTATLLALVGITLNLAISLVAFVFQDLMGLWPDRSLYVTRAFVSLVLFNGSFIIFFIVLYRKQGM